MHLLHLKPKEHSALSDGQGLPEEYCDYGRDMMALDFCSLSDHDSGFSHRGIFVTILGYEYLPRFSLYYCTGYYLNDDGPLMRGEDELYAYEASHYSGKLITPQEICKTIRGKKALIIPHHTGHRGTGGYDWDYHDGELQRLVEIYSKFGSSEYPNSLKPLGTQAANRFVQNALERGYRLGFTGGSDTHVGRPGSDGFDLSLIHI